MATIIDRINETRGDKSVYAFAKHLGLKQASLDRYLKGERKPSVELIYSVCQLCGVSADWLLGLSDERGAAATSDVAQLQLQLANLTRENESLRMALEAMLASRKSAPSAVRADAS